MLNKLALAGFAIVLLLTAVGAFILGRESAKPSTTRAVAGLLFKSPWQELGAGLIEDARRLYDGARLDICLQDTQDLAELNKELSDRLGTSEARLRESLQAKAQSDRMMKEYYEQAKKQAEQSSCEEWSNAPVCPGVRGLLRSTDGNQSGVD